MYICDMIFWGRGEKVAKRIRVTIKQQPIEEKTQNYLNATTEDLIQSCCLSFQLLLQLKLSEVVMCIKEREQLCPKPNGLGNVHTCLC